jgi:hypothetical protein
VIGQLLVAVRLLGCWVGWLGGVAGVSLGQTVSVLGVWMNENADVLPPWPPLAIRVSAVSLHHESVPVSGVTRWGRTPPWTRGLVDRSLAEVGVLPSNRRLGVAC